MIVFPVSFIKSSSGDSLRAALTTSVAAYDSATVGNWVSITSTEYANVKATVSGATTIGHTETEMGQTGSSWTGSCAYVGPVASATISSGSYVICFSNVIQSASSTASCLISTTYAGTYSVVGNTPSFNSVTTTRFYYLRKAPTDSTSATSYLGSVIASGSRRMTTTTFAGAQYDCSAPYSTWSLWNSGAPQQQFVTTTTKTW
jgi:hypothetical protein